MSFYREKPVIMNKKVTALFSLLIILSFIGYIIFDAASGSGTENVSQAAPDTVYKDLWVVADSVAVNDGKLTSVAASPEGTIYLGGESFIKSLDSNKSELWKISTENRITALAISGDTLYAATPETILLVSSRGEMLNEWGPFEMNPIITSVSADDKKVAFADAGSKRIFILNKNGEVSSMLGQSENQFVVPSPYFDVALSGNYIFIAHTGKRRIEKWTTEGIKVSEFGEPGTAPGAFCGCCNPSHFALIPQGFVTSEKGINRIKILDAEGRFVEFVSSLNNFTPSVPLDIASADGTEILAADNMKSKLYIFHRK
jgi:hypothetical protein